MSLARSYTWTCDDCGEQEVQSAPAFSQHNADAALTIAGANVLPPEGWFAVQVNVGGEVSVYAFCQYNCLKQYLKHL